MNALIALTKRNALVYLRDKASVFFSFLSVLIVIMLYALFLGDLNVKGIEEATGGAPGVRFLVDSWIMAGILVVSSITVPLAVFGTWVSDQAEKRTRGFLVTPVPRGRMAASHLLSAWMVGMLMCLVAFVLAEAYIVLNGGQLLPPLSIVKVLGLLALNVLSGSAFTFFMVSFVKSTGAFGAVSTILGTLIGFLTGVYIPIVYLPTALQTLTKCIPATHGAALMRSVFVAEPMKMVFAGAPAGVADQFNEEMANVLLIGGAPVPDGLMIAVLIGSTVLFLGLSVLVMGRKNAA